MLDLHIGFETAEPWPLQRVDKDGVTPKRAILSADKERNVITVDEQTSLAGRPGRGMGLPPGQPLGLGLGAGPVQRAQASRPDDR